MGCSPCSPMKPIQKNYRLSILTLKNNPILSPTRGKNKRGSVVNDMNYLSNNIKVLNEENTDPFSQYSSQEFVKQSRLCSIYTVIHNQTGKKRLMKVFSKKKFPSSEFTNDDLVNQIEILKNLSHPNIIKLYEVFTYNQKIYMIYEYCSYGNLLDILEKEANFSEEKCRSIMLQIFSALNYCHNKGIIHNDLCPEHLVCEKTKSGFNIKIINFGSFLLVDQKTGFSPRKQVVSAGYRSVSNPYFSSPESKKGNIAGITEKTDMWSCGVLMYLLLSGELPFKTKEELETYRLRFNNSDIWDSVSTDAIHIIKKLIVVNPSKRLGADEVLALPYFRDEEYSKGIKGNKKQINAMLANMRKFNYKFKLKDAITSYMVHHMLKKEDNEIIRNYFNIIDQDHNGKISKKELVCALEKIMTPIQANLECEKILKNLNKENQEEIEYEDFIKSAMDQDKLINEKNLRMIFNIMDKGGNGKINKYDLKNFFLGAFTTDSLLADDNFFAEIIREIDSNGDGMLEFSDFKKMMLK